MGVPVLIIGGETIQDLTKLPSTENWHVKALRKIQALFTLILLALVGCQAADVPNSVTEAEEPG